MTVPPGALRVTFQENVPKRAEGVFLKDLALDSPLTGKVPVGAFLVSINGIYCAHSDLNQIQAIIMSTAQSVRRFTFEVRQTTEHQQASAAVVVNPTALLPRDPPVAHSKGVTGLDAGGSAYNRQGGDNSLQSELGTVSLL
jgi:hypothetical protein